ncbi:host attachment protein [Nannocystis sp.]|jgi:protein required for attachment to host cells|uniref:host attachment protein n=1 Tax=Nannocystis sp. TaxID=1962667 RepID=UPI002421016E|nr:host attachment protein [Nannocystis sp.]MBK7824904.1 host attachment protein [Nannocystis sp.]MBK9752842.1 host attachment protein [Nannocystis sp.]
MEATWFVVADRSQAQLFEVEGTRLRPKLKPLETIEHPEARRSEARRNGASSSSGMRDLLADNNSTHEEQDRKFVRQLLDRLTQAQHQRQFDRLVIAAPADFVGRLRELAARSLAKSVVREIIGDYTNDTLHALQERARQKEWLH